MAKTAKQENHDIEAIKAQARKEALAELQKELGISQADLDVKKAQKEREKQQVRVNLGRKVCRINGKYFTGQVTVSAPVAEVLLEMASKSNDRILSEKFSRKYQIEQLPQGGFTSRLLSVEQLTE